MTPDKISYSNFKNTTLKFVNKKISDKITDSKLKINLSIIKGQVGFESPRR